MSFSTLRVVAGLTLDEVSREFGVSPGVVRDWEKGRAKPPPNVARSLEVIGRMAGHIKPTGIKPRQAEFEVTRDAGSLFKGDKLIKSKKRVADHGEVFTPPWLVEKMLNLVKGESERIDSRFLEPACGSGNFLVPILQRKLAAVEAKYRRNEFEKRHFALLALTCCYGIELLADNIAECRNNMLEVFAEYLRLSEDDELYHAGSHVLSLNLIHGDAMAMRGADGEPIRVVEWGYIGKGKFMRRDFLLEDLARRSSVREEALPFSDPKLRMVFIPVGVGRPMRVSELAAAERNDVDLLL